MENLFNLHVFVGKCSCVRYSNDVTTDGLTGVVLSHHLLLLS